MINTKKRIRWRVWDYSSAGAYFVTICTQNKETFFGEIIPNTETQNQNVYWTPHSKLDTYLNPSSIGQVAYDHWSEIPAHYPFVYLDAFVIIPNHLHGILIFDKPYNKTWTPNRLGPQKDNLPDVIRTYKGSVTRWANQNNVPFKWQARYYDRVIRNLEELDKIRIYIWNNPLRWLNGSSRL